MSKPTPIFTCGLVGTVLLLGCLAALNRDETTDQAGIRPGDPPGELAATRDGKGTGKQIQAPPSGPWVGAAGTAGGDPPPRATAGGAAPGPPRARAVNREPEGRPQKPPKERIDELCASFEGRALQTRLWREGRRYSQIGLAEAKEFILNVPPGAAGQSALTGAAHGTPAKHAAEVFRFIVENQEEIGEPIAIGSILDLLDVWVERDLDGAREFVATTDLGTVEQRERWRETVQSYLERTEGNRQRGGN